MCYKLFSCKLAGLRVLFVNTFKRAVYYKNVIKITIQTSEYYKRALISILKFFNIKKVTYSIKTIDNVYKVNILVIIKYIITFFILWVLLTILISLKGIIVKFITWVGFCLWTNTLILSTVIIKAPGLFKLYFYTIFTRVNFYDYYTRVDLTLYNSVSNFEFNAIMNEYGASWDKFFHNILIARYFSWYTNIYLHVVHFITVPLYNIYDLFIILCNFLWVFLSNVGVLLLLTLVIATITLIERKVLALVQRRVGPNYIGYRGRLQFIADALKLLLKHIYVLPRANRFLFMLIPAATLIVCYLFWVNLIWGPSLAICEIEYNLLFMTVLSALFSLLLFLVGWITKSKYAILSSNRALVVMLNLEILLNFLLLFLLMSFESFSFYQITSMQSGITWGIWLFLPILPLLALTFLLETGRIPFDLCEAESELIAGYTVEMGGFFFALFYLGEYFHLFCFSVLYSLCLLGGWAL